jgi:hypothetical protein
MGMILKSGVGPYANTFVFLIVGAYFGSNCPQSFSQNTAVREQVSSPQAIQSPAIIYRGPIIDVHLHTDPPISAMGVPNPVTGSKPAATPTELRDSVIEQCKRYNIVRGVLNGYPGTLKSWVDKDPKRFISAPMILEQDKHPVIDVATLRQELREGRAGALGEIISQYVGLEPNDPARTLLGSG